MTRIHLSTSIGLFALALACAGDALALAGRIEFATGGGIVRGSQGVRPMARGLELDSGDTVLTADGRAQIRFTDGAFVSLQPNTEFAIRDYKFEGKTDGSEKGLFGLAKGTVRAVTGLIGRVNRDAYKVITPTATVGIRGTGGLLSVGADGATSIIGTAGTWTLTNRSGTVEVPAGTAARAPADQGQPPQRTSEAPQAPPAPPAPLAQVPISKAENRNAEGGSVAATVSTDKAKSIAVAYSEMQGGTNPSSTATLKDSPTGQFQQFVTGTVGPAGELTSFTYNEIFPGGTSSLSYSFGGTLNEAGQSGPVSWGRWTGPATVVKTANGQATTTSNFYPANGGFHYVFGAPATTMPTTGQFTYNMIGATAVTTKDASLAPGSVTSAALTGSFTPTGGFVSYNMGFAINSQNYVMLASGQIFNVSSFSGSGTVTGGACSTSCTGIIQGGFFGAAATHAGVAYSAGIGGAKQVGGVTALAR